MHLYFMDMLPQSMEFAAHMPPETDVFISTDSAGKKAQIEEAFRALPLHSVSVYQVENRGRDVGAFLCDLAPHLEGYDYACFMHDKKAIQTRPGSVGASFGYVCNENICKNAEYVLNVLTEFERDPYLGILCPPFPTHGVYFLNMCSGGWGPNFDNTKALARELGLSAPMSGEKTPIAPFGSVFWFRPKALAPLFAKGWQHTDFPEEPLAQDGTISHAIERIYPFAAQEAGYYPAVDEPRLRSVADQCDAGLRHRSCSPDGTGAGLHHLLGRVPGGHRFCVQKHFLLQSYGPYENTKRRQTRNWLRDHLPESVYQDMMKAKRTVFGPHEGPYEE